MKKVLASLLVATMTMTLFVGCTQTPEEQAASSGGDVAEAETETTETTAEPADNGGDQEAMDAMDVAIQELDATRGDGKSIGVVAFNQANDWNINAVIALEEYFEPLGYTVDMVDTNGDPAAASAAIDTFIANNVAGIVISGGEQNSLVEASAKIVDAGIPFSCIDMFQEGAVISTMADNWGGGTQLGLWTLNKLEGAGKVLILDTPSWVTLKARADAADVVFDPFRGTDPKTSIVTERFDIDAGNAVTDAQTKVAAALAADTDGDIKAIVTSWNLPAIGAYAALKDAGRTEDIVIASGDTGTDVMMAMREEGAPEWVFMGQGAYTLAERAAKGLDLEINGKGDVVPFAMFGPTYFVSNAAGANDPVTDGSTILHQSPEVHWEDVLGRPYGQ